MKIEIERRKSGRSGEIDLDRLGFGEVFSDHMFECRYRQGAWRNPRIVPFGDISISPSTCSLHYGQAVFEGLKAFRSKDGTISIFRPEKYFERFTRSCERLCIPTMEADLFMSGLRTLVDLDRDWVPAREGYSLYVRPFIFATDTVLKVHPSSSFLFMIITSPVGAYYAEGINPVSLVTSGEYVRAIKGGLGAAKTPANYAASLLPAEKAHEKGFTQVLWLDGAERSYIEEVGTMNIMFVIDDKLITPPLDGSILPGVTRDSVLGLARSWGLPVRERRITIEEVVAAGAGGRLQEVFGTGTAAVISPVGVIVHGETRLTVNGQTIGPLAQRLYDEITGIQYGTRPDPFGWRYNIDKGA